MDQGVVFCEDIELGAQEVVTKLLCDCPFKEQEFQLHAGVVGLVLLGGTQPSTCVGQDPSLPTLITSQIKDSSLHSQKLVTPQVKGSSHHKPKACHKSKAHHNTPRSPKEGRYTQPVSNPEKHPVVSNRNVGTKATRLLGSGNRRDTVEEWTGKLTLTLTHGLLRRPPTHTQKATDSYTHTGHL